MAGGGSGAETGGRGGGGESLCEGVVVFVG